MDKSRNTLQQIGIGTLLGVFLIVLGVVFLGGEIFHISTGPFVWPFFIIVPGVLLFLGALTTEKEMGRTLSILSGIVTMVGVILLLQSITNLWASWSYAWALVAPTGAGVGQWLYGWLKGQQEFVKTGKQLVKIGLSIFVVAAFFFELVIGVSGFGLTNYGLPLLLILLGLFLLWRNMHTNFEWRKQ